MSSSSLSSNYYHISAFAYFAASPTPSLLEECLDMFYTLHDYNKHDKLALKKQQVFVLWLFLFTSIDPLDDCECAGMYAFFKWQY